MDKHQHRADYRVFFRCQWESLLSLLKPPGTNYAENGAANGTICSLREQPPQKSAAMEVTSNPAVLAGFCYKSSLSPVEYTENIEKIEDAV